MNNRLILLVSLLFIGLNACKHQKDSVDKLVLIETELGNIKIKLYNQTPIHRDNFIKLIDEGFYDGLIFHRVIKGFMIQGGDPKSKSAPIDLPLGNGGPGYTLPAEIVFPKYFHKRGALAAARQADRFNPKKESSGSQFYIVTGTVQDSIALVKYATRKNDALRNAIFNKIAPQFSDSMNFLMYSNMPEKLIALQDSIMAMVDREFLKEHTIFTFNKEQIKTYTSIGGTPFLDGDYTVFGEVIEGMNVVDSINSVSVNDLDRPNNDIEYTIKVVGQ